MKETFLQLVRLGIGHEASHLPEQVDWEELKALAEGQGLSGVLADGMEKLPQEQRPPKPVVLQLIGEVLNGYEYRFELYRRAIAEMAAFYNSHGFKMMVVKGYACSMDWPKPEHRPTGDIDVWQFGQQEAADAALAAWFKSPNGSKVQGANAEIDNSHHHHTVFHWRDFMVENHYDFLNVHHHKSNVELERILKELAMDDSHYVELYGEKVYLPSANLHALFLTRHASAHFASTGMNLRNVLDWGFFVEKHHDEVDWDWLNGVLEKYGMKKFFDCVNAICVEDLGFPPVDGLEYEVDGQLKDRVLNETLAREFDGVTPAGLLRRVVFKYRRWRANAWKHKLCYSESMWSAFWSGVWNHLLKPSSI